ncbi:hypothetical protein GCM10009827_120210 [Dactylosporangium maewongense]|uniref:AB hydrolase-1 domain-containing protein n=2 Tax=Dactylosporangium maewongense TaxID=634393 RepID=A0ABN2DMY3_9ACTN
MFCYRVEIEPIGSICRMATGGTDVTTSLDPLVTDPAEDLRPPASTPALAIDSGGETLLGLLHVPAGPGPHPIVIMLHGFPGNERNFDLAQAFRRAGYAALVFHYRGSWGVGGSWSWEHVLEDVARVLAAVRDGSLVATHRLDPARLCLIGHSLGGFAALMSAAADPSVVAVASVAGFDLSVVDRAGHADPVAREAYIDMFDGELLPLRGTSGKALVAEIEAAGPGWALTGLAASLANRPVLLVGAGEDHIVTPVEVHHRPLVEAYLAHPANRLEHHVLPADHALSGHRVQLARLLLSFLDRHLRPVR